MDFQWDWKRKPQATMERVELSLQTKPQQENTISHVLLV